MKSIKLKISLVIGICVVVTFSVAANAQRRRGGGFSGFSFRFLGPWRATVSLPSRASPATPPPIMPARRRAASGNPPTAATSGRRSSTATRSGDRRAGGGALRSQHCLGRDRRSLGDPRQRDGQRDLQIHRRREDLDANGSGRDRAHWPHHRAPEESRHRFRVRRGAATGPQQERGVYRTTDGGAHWDRVLFADEKRAAPG